MCVGMCVVCVGMCVVCVGMCMCVVSVYGYGRVCMGMCVGIYGVHGRGIRGVCMGMCGVWCVWQGYMWCVYGYVWCMVCVAGVYVVCVWVCVCNLKSTAVVFSL